MNTENQPEESQKEQIEQVLKEKEIMNKQLIIFMQEMQKRIEEILTKLQ